MWLIDISPTGRYMPFSYIGAIIFVVAAALADGNTAINIACFGLYGYVAFFVVVAAQNYELHSPTNSNESSENQ